MRFFFDTRTHRETIVLEPGEYCTAAGDRVISTVLGSCVAVCLKDDAAGLGGMNHFMLPRAAASAGQEHPAPGRYGDRAIDLLVEELLLRGALRERIRAKVFGGGRILSAPRVGNAVSDANVEEALARLEAHGIPIVAQELGGERGRRIQFFVASGTVRLYRLDSVDAP